MKHKNSTFTYTNDLRDDLYRVFLETKKEMVSKGLRPRIVDIVRECITRPSSRFWASEEQVLTYIYNIELGRTYPKMMQTKKDMYYEIYSRVLRLKKRKPKEDIRQLVCEVCEQPAPRFYLTFSTARNLIFMILKEKKKCNRATY